MLRDVFESNCKLQLWRNDACIVTSCGWMWFQGNECSECFKKKKCSRKDCKANYGKASNNSKRRNYNTTSSGARCVIVPSFWIIWSFTIVGFTVFATAFLLFKALTTLISLKSHSSTRRNYTRVVSPQLQFTIWFENVAKHCGGLRPAVNFGKIKDIWLAHSTLLRTTVLREDLKISLEGLRWV